MRQEKFQYSGRNLIFLSHQFSCLIVLGSLIICPAFNTSYELFDI